ncbi:MAG: ribosome-associated translation inhibitor RaiA [Myxococcota bacterium]
MGILVTFRHMKASKALKQHCINQIRRLRKHVRQLSKAEAILSPAKKGLAMVEILVTAGKARIQGHNSSSDMYTSINQTIHKIETQLHKRWGKLRGKRHENARSKKGNGNSQ